MFTRGTNPYRVNSKGLIALFRAVHQDSDSSFFFFFFMGKSEDGCITG